MNPQLNSLFEIKQTDATGAAVPKPNAVLHACIRLAVLIAIVLAFMVPSSLVDTMEMLIFVYAGILFQVLWFVFLLIEAIVLQYNKKTQLTNANFILIAVGLPFYIMALNAAT